MSILPTNTAKKNTSSSTDQPVSTKMVLAIHQALITDVEMSKHGNGPMLMTSSTHMHQVSCHQLIEDLLTLVTLERNLSGPIPETLDKPLLSKYMDQINRLPSRLSPNPQLIKFHSLPTSNLATQVNGSSQVEMILMDVAKFKLGNFHLDSMERTSKAPRLNSLLT